MDDPNQDFSEVFEEDLREFDDFVAVLRGSIQAGHPFEVVNGAARDVHGAMFALVLKVGVMADAGAYTKIDPGPARIG